MPGSSPGTSKTAPLSPACTLYPGPARPPPSLLPAALLATRPHQPYTSYFLLPTSYSLLLPSALLTTRPHQSYLSPPTVTRDAVRASLSKRHAQRVPNGSRTCLYCKKRKRKCVADPLDPTGPCQAQKREREREFKAQKRRAGDQPSGAAAAAAAAAAAVNGASAAAVNGAATAATAAAAEAASAESSAPDEGPGATGGGAGATGGEAGARGQGAGATGQTAGPSLHPGPGLHQAYRSLARGCGRGDPFAHGRAWQEAAAALLLALQVVGHIDLRGALGKDCTPDGTGYRVQAGALGQGCTPDEPPISSAGASSAAKRAKRVQGTGAKKLPTPRTEVC